ncbi:putative biosynthetic protein (TIGR04098 family) [Actinopolyspora lacussalsi]|nr:putative biosynthetic protein (TIGR04098 family) [Actinopolyspora lacussalsi]
MTETTIRPEPGPHVLDGSNIARTEVVRPAMCGPLSLFAARVGDWTWDAVTALCGTDVLTATDGSGEPAYLSFCYYRIRCGAGVAPASLTFGDRLDVTSGLFGLGSESVLTLHRIGTTGQHEPPAGSSGPEPVDVEEFRGPPPPRTLHVENFNRWITRSRSGSNEGLVRAAPPGFRHRRLPAAPDWLSPRWATRRARTEHTLLEPSEADEHIPSGAPVSTSYEVDITRDLNGVGLVYFASYFAMVDRAVHHAWRAAGGDDAAFRDRGLLDHRLCYLGNAEAGARLELRVIPLRHRQRPTERLHDVTISDSRSGRLLAVAAVRQLIEESR